MPFVKGKSGNPTGRPKEDPEFKELCREHSAKSFKNLLRWEKSDNPKASVAASVHILEWAHGKPSQDVQVTGELSITVNLTEKKGGS